MSRKKKILISIFIYIVALLPRLNEIQKTPIFGDEVTWTVWGKELIYSIIKGNFESYSQQAWYNDNKIGHNIGLPLNWLIGAGHIIATDESRLGLGLLPPIIASRVVNIVINSFVPVAMFLIGSQLISPFASFTAAILYSLTPVIIGVDRWVFHDSILTLLTFLSVGSFVVNIKKRKFSIFPGIFLGLAFLTKILGVLSVIPWFILAIPKKNRRFVVRMIVANFISAMATILIVWPESWRRPVISIFEYTFKIIHLPGDETPSFYFGRSILDPGPTFYFFQLLARLPEIIIFLLSLAFFRIIKIRKIPPPAIISVAVFCLVYFTYISFVPLKTSFRYLLPILPWLYIFMGNYFTKQKMIQRKLLLLVAVGHLIITNIYYHPDYYVYYNKLVGGPKNAANFDQVPLCYASKSALEYLNKNNIQGTIYIAGCMAGEPYYNSGRIFTKNYQEADIIIVGTELRQKDPAKLLEILRDSHLIKKIDIKGSPVGEIWLRD